MNPARTNHQVRVRNSAHNETYHLQVTPSVGVAPESQSQNFALPRDPLEDIPNDPRSWETSLEIRVLARAGNTILYQTSMLYNLRHQSADLTQFDFVNPVAPTDPSGNYPSSFTDSRPTGTTGYYRYEIFRQQTGLPGTLAVGSRTHGITGAFQPEKDHAPVVRGIDLPVVVGEQVFWIQTRATFKNSAGTSLGPHDIAPKSPDLNVELYPEP